MKRPRSLRRSLARLARLVRRSPAAPRYMGPLVDVLRRLNDDLDRGAITPEDLVRGVGEAWAAADLEAELGRLLVEPAGSLQRIGFRQLPIHDLGKGRERLWLFFVPAGVTYPPHAHHDILSVQCLVRGRVHLRQYDREARLDPQTLGLRPVSERVLAPGGTILMTEFLDNVHWFGAEGGPAVILNYHRSGMSPRTFDPRDASRPPARYFVDPTGKPGADGLVAAPHLTREDAITRFAARPLGDFPFPI